MLSHKTTKFPVEFKYYLILQSWGSLGAYGCGACKTFAKKNIAFDIIAGTSTYQLTELTTRVTNWLL